MNDLRETNKLLAKIWFELREMNARARKQAGEETAPAQPKSYADVTSVTRDRVTGRMTADDTDVPSGLTPEMREAQRAQQPGGGRPGPGPRADVQSVEPEREREPSNVLRLTAEQLRSFGRR